MSNASTRVIHDWYAQGGDLDQGGILPASFKARARQLVEIPLTGIGPDTAVTTDCHQGFATPAACRCERGWFDAELLVWWIDADPIPVLVTTSPNGTPVPQAGRLSRSDTRVLIGGSAIDFEALPGGRFTGGWWLGGSNDVGVELGGFFLEEGSETLFAGAGANGLPILSRPLINPINNTEFAQLIAYPTAQTGAISVTTSSRLWGMEVNSVLASAMNMQVIVGFRYLDLDEDLDIVQGSTLLQNGIFGFNGAPILAPNSVSIADSFAARNRFYGGQVGLRGQLPMHRKWSLGYTGKLGIGGTHQSVNVSGTSVLNPNSANPQTATGGLLALPSNIGHHSRHEFTILMQIGLKLKYQCNEHIHMGFGYDFLWWSDVLRPGDQIDRTVDPRQLPTSLQFNPTAVTTRPGFRSQGADFWAQGLNLELGFRF